MGIRKNKKAIIVDLRFILGIFFAFLLVTGVTYAFWSLFNDEIQNMDFVQQVDKDKVNSIGDIYFFLDSLVPFIFLGLWALVLMSSLLVVPDHPAFFILGVAGLLGLTFMGIILHDIGVTFMENTLLATYFNGLANITFFVNNYHYISFAVSLISIVIFYSRRSGGLDAGVSR